MRSTVKQPSDCRAHAQPAERPNDGRDLRVVIEKVHAREQIIPVVNDVAAIADGEQRKLLRASVGHVRGNGKKLFEKEKCAEGCAGDVAFRREIDGESKRGEELQKSAACDGNPLAEKAKDQVPAFVNGYKDDVNHQHGAAVTIGLEQKEQIKSEPGSQRPSRNGLPFFLEAFKERKTRSEIVRKIHGGAGRVRSAGGRGD